jgi:hypothetical protein
MLVVKVEVWPGGNEADAFEISRIGIANTSVLDEVSDYEVTALLSREAQEEVVVTEVLKHERSGGWVPLVRRVLTNLLLRSELCRDGTYDDPVVKLLRRGDHAGKRTNPHRDPLGRAGS